MGISFIIVTCLILATTVTARSCTKVTQRLDCGSLTCNTTTHQCVPCTESFQCYQQGYKCDNGGQCVMMSLPESFRISTIFAPIVAIVVGAIAAVAGVGGGAILVPAYIWLLGLPIGDVVPLSQATIFGLSVVNSLMQIRRNHPRHSPPNATWPLVNWEYLIMLLPSLMVGTMLGSMGNKVSPGWFRVVLLIILLTFVLYRLVKKTISQRMLDAQANKNVAENAPLIDSAQPVVQAYLQSNASKNSYGDALKPAKVSEQSLVEVNATVHRNEEGGSVLQSSVPHYCSSLLVPNQAFSSHGDFIDQKPQYPWRLLAAAFVLFTVQLSFVLVNSHTLAIVSCGGTAYWTTVGAAIIWSIAAAVAIRAYLNYLRHLAVEGKVHANIVPFKWSWVTSAVFPTISFVAGAAASMLGIGGGMILNFLLLEAGLLPEEVSATGGFATLLVAAQSILLFLLEDNLQWDFAILLFLSGAISAVVGQLGLVRPIKKRGLTFLFIFALLIIMGGSLISLSVYGIYETVEIVSSGGSPLFGRLCN